ncbi:phosphodiester glycosidase family protein [Paenibacillus pini]|uniref:Phosphodiester glycosidase domain-containing protein n=1 Tax=Paenibacillus pini JCM 16418 TaxID=1236976 RepID=W7YCN0_9BACL|nr:phosphodiester glycosidase family protein [Paenibacillus pini]GAF06202.1 hypothetical protein JCM16418_150 [Paenibacillus pini JCM 16418]
MQTHAQRSWGKWGLRVLAILTSVSFLLLSQPETSKVFAAPSITNEVKKVAVGSRAYTVQILNIPKGTPVTVGLAKGQVGQTQDLKSIVKKYNAQAAINGAFFEAYHGVPDPYGNLIINNNIAHIGRYGTTVGFKKDGTVLMDSLWVGLTGKVTPTGGSSQGWYATFINRTPAEGSNVSIIYNSYRGDRVGFKGGTAITIRNGIVMNSVPNHNVLIPKDGYVLVCMGTEQSMAKRFVNGAAVELNVTYADDHGKALPWEDVVTAVGAGPRLVKDGSVALNPAAEGFKDQKILTSSAARSGIAIKADGSVMIATVSGATMKEWAAIMQKMGVKQAMNLDGGASSGMFGSGRTLTNPGRLLSNTLVFGSNVNP